MGFDYYCQLLTDNNNELPRQEWETSGSILIRIPVEMFRSHTMILTLHNGGRCTEHNDVYSIALFVLLLLGIFSSQGKLGIVTYLVIFLISYKRKFPELHLITLS